MKNETVTVVTVEFQINHGHLPKGRGSWAFNIPNPYGTESVLFWARGADGLSSLLYTEARKIAVQEAQRRGVSFISVAP